jgi:hypothetical protein
MDWARLPFKVSVWASIQSSRSEEQTQYLPVHVGQPAGLGQGIGPLIALRFLSTVSSCRWQSLGAHQ